MSLGFTEILLIIGVVLLLFGAKKIPDLARALGRASYEFKKAKSALEEESKELIASAEKNAELADQQDAEKTDSETRS
jgi:sec-independent protein translocase protein TatA